MRIALVIPFALLFASVAGAADEKANPEVVKAVRAVISAKKSKDVTELKRALFARPDLDWVSVKQGLMDGPYYSKPMVTEFGLRNSGKDFGLRLSGEDGKERGFSIYVPEGYEGKEPLPVLFYLHQDCMVKEPNAGAERAVQALLRFRKLCDEQNVFFVAPYTAAGAEWWMPDGKELVAWTLDEVKRRYNIDENRVALMGNNDGGEGVWAIAQQMPGTFSCLMPMTADPYEVTGMVRPLYLGTLDRMDVLMGVTGSIRGALGTKNTNQYMDALDPLFKKGMRVTTAIFPQAQTDFRYLENIQDTAMAWARTKKRNALAIEVDVESNEPEGLRSLWLAATGVDPEGDSQRNFPTTHLKWKPPAPGKGGVGDKKLGVNLRERAEWEYGILIERASGQADKARIRARDVILEVADTPVKKTSEVGPLVQQYDFGTDVPLLLARMVRPGEMEREKKLQAVYLKYRERTREMVANGEEVPDDLWERMMDEALDAEEKDEEEEEEESSIEINDGSEEGGEEDVDQDEEQKDPEIFIFRRWVRLKQGEPPFVRVDFGAGVDHTWRESGVRIGRVTAGTIAWRAGLRSGDVITGVQDNPVENTRDLADFFAEFKFEKEPPENREVKFTIRRMDKEMVLTAKWETPVASRVDARWDKKENALNVMCRNLKGFTLYFTDELVPPNEEFHLYINGVPYQDLMDPDSMPEYPRMGPHGGGMAGDKLYRMRKKRAKVAGWKPDYEFAVSEFLKNRDRELVLGNKLTIDMHQFKQAFKKVREKSKPKRFDFGAALKEAYEKFRSEG